MNVLLITANSMDISRPFHVKDKVILYILGIYRHSDSYLETRLTLSICVCLLFYCNNSLEDLKVHCEFSLRREHSGVSALLEKGYAYGYSPEVRISSCSLPLHHFLHDNHDECPFYFKALFLYI